MNQKILVRDPDIPAKRQRVARWHIPKRSKKEMLQFLDELALGKVNKGIKIAENTLAKYLCVLKVPLEYFNKPTQQLTLKDIEAFERAISTGNLKSTRNKPYSHAMRVDIRIALRIFLRWRLGSKGTRMTDWFDCRDIHKTPDYLKEHEIERLYKGCRSARERYLIAVLFDTGARAEEFHNIRFADVQLPEGNYPFVRVALKEEYSKTTGRTISLYWKYSLEAVREFLAERMREGIKSDEPVASMTYDSARFFFARLGQKILGRHIHFHLFRHSSATFYASQLNRQQLCIRYGWKFSSNMPDVYIARAGVDSTQLDEKFTQTELGKLKEELAKRDHEDKLKQEKIIELERKLAVVENYYEEIAEILKLRPSIGEVEAAIGRKLRLREGQ